MNYFKSGRAASSGALQPTSRHSGYLCVRRNFPIQQSYTERTSGDQQRSGQTIFKPRAPPLAARHMATPWPGPLSKDVTVLIWSLRLAAYTGQRDFENPTRFLGILTRPAISFQQKMHSYRRKRAARLQLPGNVCCNEWFGACADWET